MKSSRIVKLALFGVVFFGGVKTEFADTAYSFTTIDVPGALETIPEGINNRGQIVGLVGLPLGAFLYSGGSYTTFGFPGGTQTEAHGINNLSQIVGEYVAGFTFHGFLDDGGSFTAIDVPSATAGTFASGINDSGQIVGYFFDRTEYHGFLDNGGNFISITYPGAGCSNGFSCGTFATGINNSGQVVGFFGDAAGVTHGFLYSNGSFSTDRLPWPYLPSGDFDHRMRDRLERDQQ